MANYFTISIIGAGNLASQLAWGLELAGHPILEVHSKSGVSASKLVSHLYDASVKEDLDFTRSKSQVLFVCVNDEQIKDVAEGISLREDQLLAHCSGSVSMDCLSYTHDNIGVFYPLQSFDKFKKLSSWKTVPLLIEGGNSYSKGILHTIGQSLSKKVLEANSDKRKHIHLAAVMAANFTNHLLYLSDKLLKKEGHDLTLLKPLLEESIHKAFQLGPLKAQTGPARRGDLETLEKHLSLLSAEPSSQEIYQRISQSILDTYFED